MNELYFNTIKVKLVACWVVHKWIQKWYISDSDCNYDSDNAMIMIIYIYLFIFIYQLYLYRTTQFS